MRERAIDLDRFRVRLAETIAWCSWRASRADPKHSLRTVELLPESVRSSGEVDLLQYTGKPDQMQAIAEVVADNRARCLREAGRYPAAPAEMPADGYLLFCAPNESVWDDVAEPESEGFFGSGDLPPWDAWIMAVPALARQPQGPPLPDCYLLSWVPPEFAELVDAGIYINPFGCIWWAAERRCWSESDTPLLSELAAAGLLGSVPEVARTRTAW